MVLVEFDILADGHTDSVEVIARIGHEVFERAAIESVLTWRYRPVFRDGVAVPTRDLRISIPFRMKVLRVGARPEAKDDLVAAIDSINRQDLDAAREALRALDAWEWPNLYEAQFRSLVRGIVSHLEGRSEEAIGELDLAMLYDGKYIGELGHYRALLWSVRAGYLAERDGVAYQALDTLDRVHGGRPLPRDIGQIRDELEERRRDRHTIQLETVVPVPPTPTQLSQAFYTPFRRLVRIDPVGTEFPDRLRIVCDNHQEEVDPVPGMRIEISQDWSGCTIHIYGVPGTRALFVEPPMS